MRLPTPSQLQRLHRQHVGPWECEQCHNLTQFAEIQHGANHIYCKYCGFERIIDKKRRIIVEDDKTFWTWDSEGKKEQIRGQ